MLLLLLLLLLCFQPQPDQFVDRAEGDASSVS